MHLMSGDVAALTSSDDPHYALRDELDLAIAYVTNTLGSRMAMHDPRGLALLAAVDCARVASPADGVDLIPVRSTFK